MYNRGTQVIYDLDGTIIRIDNEMESSEPILPFIKPNGIPSLEIPFGSLNGKRIIGVNVTNPELPEIITEDIPYEPTVDELIQKAIDDFTAELIEEGVIL